MKYFKLVFALWWLACTPLAMAMYFDQESGLNYNGNRSYRPPDGRYTQPDPIGWAGGSNPFGYALQNPLIFSDPLGLYTEIVQWGQSPGLAGSWGHISGNINGDNFSFGPGGWDTRYPTAKEYAERQESPDIDRQGRGLILDLSPTEEAHLSRCVSKFKKYNGFSNNCGNPWLECLDDLGITNSRGSPRVLPSEVMDIIRSSPRAIGNTVYQGRRPLYTPSK
jgi:RHS repeat-associated protein